MHWPQITWIVLVAMSFTIHMVNQGKPLEGKYSPLRSLIRISLTTGLMWAGGFFTPAHAQIPAAAAKYRQDLVRAAHNQWGLDAPVAALAAQVHQESGWNPLAVSAVGAKGMAQFMPATANWWCQQNGLSAANCQPSNPTWALRALVGYDKWLHDRVPERFAAHDRLWVALRAYNGGLGHWQAEAKLATQNTREAIDAACGKARRHVSFCAENLGYPARILGKLQPLYGAWGAVV